MKPSVRKIVLTGALVVGANAVMASQVNNTWLEQWYRAKYGRNSPTEEARQRAARENSTLHKEATARVVRPANEWRENWYRAKFGRSSPLEDARQKAVGKR